MFNEDEIRRYRRHFLVKEIGEQGQERLIRSKVLIIGAGGLGSPVALYLAAAGIGTLGILDEDTVERSNLQRQILHNTDDLEKPKVFSAEEKLNKLNPNISVIPYLKRFSNKNAEQIVSNYDIVIDGTDNYETRHIINATCYKVGIPFIHGGVAGFSGQVMTFIPGQGPCFNCIFPKSPQQVESEIGVAGPLPGIIGSIQAVEAMKYLLGKGDLLVGRLLTYDALSMEVSTIDIKQIESCPICES